MQQQRNKQPSRSNKPSTSNSKKPNKFIRFTTVAFQMGATIWLGNIFGKWLDSRYENDIWETIVTLLSVFIAMYMVIAQVIKVSKEND